jgi:hypothetical protein
MLTASAAMRSAGIMEDNKLLTLREAAAEAGVTPNALRLAIWRDKLKAQKRGRDWFVSVSDLKEWQTSKPHVPGRPKTGS